MAPSALEHAAFGIREPREIGGKDLFQTLLDLIETGLEGAARISPGELGGRCRTAGIPQEVLAGRGIEGDAVGGEEDLGLMVPERVTADGLGQAHLFAFCERTEVDRDRQRKRSGIQAAGEFGGELPGDGQSAAHPGLLPSQELSHRRDREAVLIDERLHHSCLVHGAAGTAGPIGRQEACLHLDSLGGFHDHGDFGAFFPSPEGQAFETIEDLIGAVRQRHDAERKGRQFRSAFRSLASERGEGRPKELDRDEFHEGHRGASSKGSN